MMLAQKGSVFFYTQRHWEHKQQKENTTELILFSLFCQTPVSKVADGKVEAGGPSSINEAPAVDANFGKARV